MAPGLGVRTLGLDSGAEILLGPSRTPRTLEAGAGRGAGWKLLPGAWLLFPHDLGTRRLGRRLRGGVF